MRSIPDGFVADLMALLEIPGVAVWEHGRTDLDRAAAWLGSRLERAGLQARLLDDGISPPFVYAQTEIRPDRPTLLLYGHYDVQPASLKDGWTTDPFKPDIRNGRIYARGATDQKMNLLLPVFALEEADLFGLPFNIKVFYEGQEEIFSPGLEAALLRYKDLLRSDAVFSTDGWQSSADLGDVRLGLRGFCGLEVEVHGANKDLHSGSFGGAVPNPAQALARALSRLHDDDGMITVPGFMDDATPLTEAEKTFLVAQPFDRKAWLALTGLAEGDAPDRLELQTRMGLRPTMEINALESGNYLGGFRTIVPSSARARISCRLVPGQEPDIVSGLLSDFIDRAIPKRFARQIRPLPGTSRPYRIAADDPFQGLAARILADVDGQPPRYSYSGGSIPMPGAIASVLGVGTTIFGFGLPDENMHGVDEFCRLTDIERGMAAWRLLLGRPSTMAV
ncbi:M20/M25/M40 family metallo-hydrolase [Agrobacterium vitis]|uniref:M20/M25/M40 family metallo-hydrolase n=1 Tax=Agrobacterium vitis TaxID=373 RepID=UPI0012E91710|nr:M20/M25/M40 family metallo-hydrolase [Agrobacterium vitis]MVA23878.1 M20/M25/M40 family metallo-hydrolase [Agrobacterium vitis]